MALRTFIRKMSSAAGNRQLDLRGIFIPLTTPFNADEGIAFDKLKQNLKEYEKIPFTGKLKFYAL